MTKTELAIQARTLLATTTDMATCANYAKVYKRSVRSIAKETGKSYDLVDAEIGEETARRMAAATA